MAPGYTCRLESFQFAAGFLGQLAVIYRAYRIASCPSGINNLVCALELKYLGFQLDLKNGITSLFLRGIRYRAQSCIVIGSASF